MKKTIISFLCLFSFALIACGPSRTQIQEMSSSCDALIEVRYIQNDSIAIFVGNTLFANTHQLVREEMFPFLVSKRNPTDIDIPTATTVLNSKEEFIDYLKSNVSSLNTVGIVMGENVNNEIGFDKEVAIQKITGILQAIQGGSVILFHEKGGHLTKAKKLY